MLKEERYALILATLAKEHKVTAASLSERLQLSEATVRRDLTALDALGKLRKVHGGAVPVASSVFPFRQRVRLRSEAKRQIARKTLPLLDGVRTIIIDAGTTNLALVKQLPSDFKATCITNSPTIAQQLALLPAVRIILTGGTYDAHSEALVGPLAVQTLRQLYADVCVLGVCSLHPEQGLTTDDPEQVAVKQVMVHQAQRTVALTDADKINRCDTYQIAAIGQLTAVVSELASDAEVWSAYRSQGVEVV